MPVVKISYNRKAMKTLKFTFLVTLALLTGCDYTASKKEEITTATGLRYTIVKDGTGDAAKEGDEVLIHETVGYIRGTRLFATKDLGTPIKVVVGKKQVIDGVDEGLVGMKTGEIRRLTIPPALSKRDEYPPFLSPDSTLVYEIELIKIEM